MISLDNDYELCLFVDKGDNGCGDCSEEGREEMKNEVSNIVSEDDNVFCLLCDQKG